MFLLNAHSMKLNVGLWTAADQRRAFGRGLQVVDQELIQGRIAVQVDQEVSAKHNGANVT